MYRRGDDVEPVAADAGFGVGGEVAGGDVEGVLVGEGEGEEAALQGHGGGALAGVAREVRLGGVRAAVVHDVHLLVG